MAVRLLGTRYRQIHTLKDSEATSINFISKLNALSYDRQNLALDLFLQLHGEPGELLFYDDKIRTTKLGALLKKKVYSHPLRLLYNTSCYGDSHSEDFLQAGFITAVGAVGINSNAATEYPLFCRLWGGGRTRRQQEMSVEKLLLKADHAGPRWVADRLAQRYFTGVDSKKVIRGNPLLTISG